MEKAILTETGLSKITAAVATSGDEGADNAVQITHVALGDGAGAAYEATGDMVALRGERVRRAIDSRIRADPTTWLIRVIFPAADLGTFDCAEVGYFDDDGDLIAVVSYDQVRSLGGFDYVLEKALHFSQFQEGVVTVKAAEWALQEHIAEDTAAHAAILTRLLAAETKIHNLTDGAPGALDTIVELAQALNNDQDFAANVLAQIGALKTPKVSAVANDAALNAVNSSATISVAAGVLSAPLASGAIIEHTELSDGSARQLADRITAAGVFLTRHQRLRRGGVWGPWVAIGNTIGQDVILDFEVPPPNMLEQDGRAVLRADYPDLFAAIGTTFGAGDGATTFSLPDMRGEYLRGWDHGRGADPGRAFGSWQTSSHVPIEDRMEQVHSVGDRQGARQLALEDPHITNTTRQTYAALEGTGDYGPSFYAAVRVRGLAKLFCITF